MATALFIKRSDLVKNTIMSGSVDTDKFIQYIKIAQQIHIRNYLGSDLYNKISADIASPGGLTGNYLTLVNDYVQPMLIHFAMMDYLPFAAFSVTNGGVFKGNSENAQREFAEYYTRRFIDYMNYNSNLFPEYNTNSNDDIYPDHEATFNGWVL